MPLDPAVADMLQGFAEAEGPAMTDVPPSEAREMYRAMQSTLLRPDVYEVTDDSAGEIPVRIYRPTADLSPAIVYFHGGGWVIGDLETHDPVCRQLALATGYTVIAVDYRLAPEHPFPAPLDDCYDATCWVADNARSLNIDPGRIAVAGDSAGGNLAACVSLKARDMGSPAISFQLLIYPVIDSQMNTQSYEDNADGFLLTRDSMQWFWNHYTDEDSAMDPLAAPANARNLEGLPPACIITAEFDPLRDEGEVFADRLVKHGVPTRLERFDGMIHGFFGMTDLLAGSRQAMSLAADELKAVFSNS